MHVVEVADSATYGKRNKHALSNLAYHFHVARAVLGARCNIVKNELVHAIGTILRPHFHRVADIDIALELDALRHLAVADIEANNQTFCQHGTTGSCR